MATIVAMARSAKSQASSPASYHGEVWTDGSGYATICLPIEAARLEPPLEYELRDLEPPSSARVTAELEDGRFTIATEQPHVKVAWRLTGRLATKTTRATRTTRARKESRT